MQNRAKITISLSKKTIEKLNAVRDKTFVPIGRQIELALTKAGALE